MTVSNRSRDRLQSVQVVGLDAASSSTTDISSSGRSAPTVANRMGTGIIAFIEAVGAAVCQGNCAVWQSIPVRFLSQ